MTLQRDYNLGQDLIITKVYRPNKLIVWNFCQVSRSVSRVGRFGCCFMAYKPFIKLVLAHFTTWHFSELRRPPLHILCIWMFDPKQTLIRGHPLRLVIDIEVCSEKMQVLVDSHDQLMVSVTIALELSLPSVMGFNAFGQRPVFDKVCIF